MNPVELHLIEKRFVKLSLDKNYITGVKSITYCYLNKEDYNWHRKRLESTGWEETDYKKDDVLVAENTKIKVITVKYEKTEVPDWKKKQKAIEKKKKEMQG